MATCSDCEKQKDKGRYDDPHKNLRVSGESKAFRGGMFGGYEETPYVCIRCQTKFIHSNDKNDDGWMMCS